MNKERYLLVVSGPSGVGKDTVAQKLFAMNKNMQESISATTREMRKGEADGVNYYYLTREGFEQKIAAGEVLEYTEYCGNYYGTLKNEIDKRIQAGITVVLNIEVQGASNIKRIYPDSTTVFIRPPSYEELEARLRGRGTETQEVIESRLQRAAEEMEYAVDYDFVVVNDEIDRCAQEICEIVKKRQA